MIFQVLFWQVNHCTKFVTASKWTAIKSLFLSTITVPSFYTRFYISSYGQWNEISPQAKLRGEKRDHEGLTWTLHPWWSVCGSRRRWLRASARSHTSRTPSHPRPWTCDRSWGGGRWQRNSGWSQRRCHHPCERLLRLLKLLPQENALFASNFFPHSRNIIV